ncbi:MAG: protein-L-isoaspartate(D-aspartate) O-methyltransferase [Magnetococcales bacterium]|nr:protein-L-isoaspartate(D-aspartate) O-methyltransferase [Magnetococcales bacterium]
MHPAARETNSSAGRENTTWHSETSKPQRHHSVPSETPKERWESCAPKAKHAPYAGKRQNQASSWTEPTTPTSKRVDNQASEIPFHTALIVPESQPEESQEKESKQQEQSPFTLNAPETQTPQSNDSLANTLEHGLVSDRSRDRMINELIQEHGIYDEEVLEVMREIPRHFFVDEALAGRAYINCSLPIGESQTLSQPSIVAQMSQALQLNGEEEILEIGTGSGYQTAILSRLAHRVYTIERHESLAMSARRRLFELGCDNVVHHVGDGTIGWPDDRLFDRIIVTAGAPVAPGRLAEQLAIGGLLVIPEGDRESQSLVRITSQGGKTTREVLGDCRFVPLIGAQGWEEARC